MQESIREKIRLIVGTTKSRFTSKTVSFEYCPCGGPLLLEQDKKQGLHVSHLRQCYNCGGLVTTNVLTKEPGKLFQMQEAATDWRFLLGSDGVGGSAENLT